MQFLPCVQIQLGVRRVHSRGTCIRHLGAFSGLVLAFAHADQHGFVVVAGFRDVADLPA